MSILIKGMEMPTGGDSILFRIDEKGEVVAYKVRGCKTDFLNRYKAMLIPPHGKLIDADALCEYCNNVIDHSATPNDLMRFPTIIPAEEGE